MPAADTTSLSDRHAVWDANTTDSSDEYTQSSSTSRLPLLGDPQSPGAIYRRFRYDMARAQCVYPFDVTRREEIQGHLTGEAWYDRH